MINMFKIIRSSNENFKGFIPLLVCEIIEVVISFNGKNNLNYNAPALVWSGVVAKNERLV